MFQGVWESWAVYIMRHCSSTSTRWKLVNPEEEEHSSVTVFRHHGLYRYTLIEGDLLCEQMRIQFVCVTN